VALPRGLYGAPPYDVSALGRHIFCAGCDAINFIPTSDPCTTPQHPTVRPIHQGRTQGAGTEDASPPPATVLHTYPKIYPDHPQQRPLQCYGLSSPG
jgi:hypothetical protein